MTGSPIELSWTAKYRSQCFLTFNHGLTFLPVTFYHSDSLTNIIYPQLQSDLSKKPEKVIISVSVGGGYKRGTCTPLRLNNGHVAVPAPAAELHSSPYFSGKTPNILQMPR